MNRITSYAELDLLDRDMADCLQATGVFNVVIRVHSKHLKLQISEAYNFAKHLIKLGLTVIGVKAYEGVTPNELNMIYAVMYMITHRPIYVQAPYKAIESGLFGIEQHIDINTPSRFPTYSIDNLLIKEHVTLADSEKIELYKNSKATTIFFEFEPEEYQKEVPYNIYPIIKRLDIERCFVCVLRSKENYDDIRMFNAIVRQRLSSVSKLLNMLNEK